jgi:hypothetical protein
MLARVAAGAGEAAARVDASTATVTVASSFVLMAIDAPSAPAPG